MRKLIIASPLLLSLFTIHIALAEPVAVIVNSANTQNISQADVKNIYTDKTITWASNEKIAVYNLPTEDDAADLFARRVIGISAREAATAEANRSISNASRNPQQTKRDALVASIVAKTPNAIGYLPQGQAIGKSGIRVLFILQ